MKIVCGKCSAEVELPRAGQSPKVECPSCGAVFRVPSLAEGEEFPHPDTFPGYRIRAIVGHGGMGTVYRAVQLSMDREVAIKVLLRKYADVPRFVARFEREAAALAALSHPNIVAVIDRGRQDDMYFFVMEFVHGHTLRRSIRRGEVGVERAVEIAVQICDALEAAHERGIVHRDIKPGNILIQEDGLVKVADFGIVHMIDDEAAAELERRSRLGTAKYMAPEQRGTGQGIDPRADIYGLGVTLYEALTGALPEGQPPSALNPEVPEELDRVIERALQDEPDRRFQTADEMRRALQRALDDLRAARASQAPPLPTVSCPQCGAAVAHGALACPACAHRLLEPCYRPDCPGTNPPGAERCAQCGGRLDVLREQRREELENRLRRGELLLAHGRGAEAAEEFRIVEADPHEAFQPLRHEAGEQLRELGRRSARRLARAAAIALVVAAAGVGGYLGVRRSLPLPPSKSPDERSGRRARDRDEERPGQGASRKPRPRDAFVDYLLALTSEGWGRHGPARRVLAASHAAACLADRGEDGEAARRLAATLEALGAGQEPRGDG
ncbi:MAG: protein kinase domain-containing protein, partial [Candidatus Brocadiia bacterium]